MVYYKKLLNILAIFGFLDKHYVVSFSQMLQSSPCPQIFQYEFEDGDMIARIRIECPGCRKIQLNVELSVGNRVEGYNGNIQLSQDKQQVLRDILNKNPVYYKVYFPRWQGTPPKITKISINGNLICSGPKLIIGMVPILTTINLQHTLTIDTVPLSTSSGTPSQNLPAPDPPFDVRRLPQNPQTTNEDPIFEPEESPLYSPPPPSKNGFAGDNKYNFRPQMPKNPDKIYPGNPFLTGLASTAPPTNSFPAVDTNNVDGEFRRKRRAESFENNPFLAGKTAENSYSPTPTPSSQVYSGNPFLAKVSTTESTNVPLENHTYSGNPFFTGLSSKESDESTINMDGIILETTISPNQTFEDTTDIVKTDYSNNPFLMGLIGDIDNHTKVDVSAKELNKNYPTNPFFTALSSGIAEKVIPMVESNIEANKPNNPFLSPRTSERPPTKVSPSQPEAPTFEIVPSRTGNTDGTIPYSDICGRTITTNSLIINGNSVPRGSFPWLVALFGVQDTGLNYMCSGSLISSKHVVTAAHCVKTESKRLKPQELLCILGKLNIKKWVLGDGEKMIEPERIDIHPSYETMTSHADIAVLTLSEDLEFNKYVRPICLWTGQSNLGKIVGKNGVVVGWGKDENGKVMTAEPKQITLPVVSQEQCLRSNYQFQYITSNRTFCAGFRNGSGPCNGDSGSGFIMEEDGRWMLRGIVSMSISESHTRTCDLSNYVVFTDASKYLDWLLSFIK